MRPDLPAAIELDPGYGPVVGRVASARRDRRTVGFGQELAWRTVEWAPVVVLEDVTSSRRAISDRLACSVWVEAPAAQRLRRGLERDGQSHRAPWERWMVEEAAFFAQDDTRARADVVTDGSD